MYEEDDKLMDDDIIMIDHYIPWTIHSFGSLKKKKQIVKAVDDIVWSLIYGFEWETVADKNPQLHIEAEILYQLVQSNYFSIFNVACGFYQSN